MKSFPNRKRQRPSAVPQTDLPTVLLTGADPWNGEAMNPSWEAVRILNGTTIANHRLLAFQVPTEFRASLRRVRHLLTQYRPVLVICTGQASTRSTISLERVAINLIDAPIPDNRGFQPIDTPVIHAAPVGYFSTLPLKPCLAALQKAAIPSEISESAGTFVCNALFFGLMHELATRKELRRVRGGFVHVPSLPQQAKSSADKTMPLDQIVRGLTIVIEAALYEFSSG